jgi:hypothetical protein
VVLTTTAVWHEEVERFAVHSEPRIAAEHARRQFEKAGLRRRQLLRCANHPVHGTELAGMFKVYVPIEDAPALERPFGFVLSPSHGAAEPYLAVVAFGERHPHHRGTRSVYERAHKRLHGRYPDER